MLSLRRRRAEREFAGAQLAVQEFGNWVRHADSKVTVLAAAIGVSVTLLAGRSGAVFMVLTAAGLALWIQMAVIITGIGSLVCIGAALRLVFVALAPRMDASAPRNPFSWPDVAAAVPRLPRPSRVDEIDFAWHEAGTLASIARKKYGAFRRALEWFLVSVVFTCACLLLTESELAWSST